MPTALADAREPFVVFGGGTAGAAEAARALVERLGAPAALTINAKGVLPAGHPLNLGSSLPQPPVLAALQAADVVLAIGTELGSGKHRVPAEGARRRVRRHSRDRSGSSADGQAIQFLSHQAKPVVAYITDQSSPQRAGYVGADNWKLGRTAAWFIAQTTCRPGRVQVLIGNHRYHCQDISEASFAPTCGRTQAT